MHSVCVIIIMLFACETVNVFLLAITCISYPLLLPKYFCTDRVDVKKCHFSRNSYAFLHCIRFVSFIQFPLGKTMLWVIRRVLNKTLIYIHTLWQHPMIKISNLTC